MIMLELQASSDYLIKHHEFKRPLVLPAIFGYDSSLTDASEGVMMGIASSRKQADSVLTALAELHAYIDECSVISSENSSTNSREKTISVAYVSKSFHDLLIFRIVKYMVRTRLNIAVV